MTHWWDDLANSARQSLQDISKFGLDVKAELNRSLTPQAINSFAEQVRRSIPDVNFVQTNVQQPIQAIIAPAQAIFSPGEANYSLTIMKPNGAVLNISKTL